MDNSTADGVIQVSDVRGNVGIGATVPLSAAAPVIPALMAPPTSSEGQSVTNTEVDGFIRQVRGVDGDVEIDR